MIIVGLTGPTGAGKTTACDVFRRLGAAVIEADKSAREVTRKGCPVLLLLAEAFGEDILEDGELNRKKLAARAFANENETEKLNGIILPHIIEYIKGEIAELDESGFEFLVLDAPTLFESGCHKLCHKTVALLSDVENRLPRIISRDSISEADALLRIGAGKSDEFYKSKVDFLLYNNGSAEELMISAKKLFQEIKSSVGGR